MTNSTYSNTEVVSIRKAAEPTKEEVEAILSEMDRYGPNRGWVLAGVIARARMGQPVAWPSFGKDRP